MTELVEMAMDRAEGDPMHFALSERGRAALADLARTVERVTGRCGPPGDAAGDPGNELALKDLRRLVSLVEDVASAQGLSLEALRDQVGSAAASLDPATPQRRLLDADADPDEQLPRRFTVTMTEKPINGRLYVTTQLNGVIVGDRLSDRIHGHPGSRYHDVFHFAHVAALGWSPVARNMLGRKRVSEPAKLEFEDCTRAQVIEEAVVSAVFGTVRRNGFDLEGRPVPEGLIDTIRDLTRGYEVESCSDQDWAQAIRLGTAAYHGLVERRGGQILVDMHQRTLRPLA